MRACSEPRCPEAFDGPWFYCADHRSEDKEHDAAHDAALGIIESAREETADIVRFVERTRDYAYLGELARRQMEEVRQLEDAIFFGPPGTAAYHALMVGHTSAVIDAMLTEHALRERIAAMKENARIGARTRLSPGRPPKAQPEVVRDEVQRLLDSGQVLKAARRTVARRHQLSFDRVKKLTPNMRAAATSG